MVPMSQLMPPTTPLLPPNLCTLSSLRRLPSRGADFGNEYDDGHCDILLENVLSIAYSCSSKDEKFCISLHVADGIPMLVELLANANVAIQEGACAVLCCCCECGLGEEGESAASRAGNSMRHYLLSSEALLSLVWMLDHASQIVRESSRKSECLYKMCKLSRT